MQFIVTETRGHEPENVHAISVALFPDENSSHLASQQTGDNSPRVFARSTTKPFQAIPLLALEPALTSEQLAVCCASHSGTDRHQRVIRSILARAGLSEGALCCGVHEPIDAEARQALRQAGQQPSALHHNCSGKHAGMLLVCQYYGWPTHNYLDRAHPLQQLIADEMSDVSGCNRLYRAVDGCGAPTFQMPLSALARLYAQLIADHRLAVIKQAMQQHPQLVGGPGRLDTSLMEATDGNLIVKVGADGVMAMANERLSVGMALKVWSGNERVRNRFTVWWLREHGWLTPSQYDRLPSALTDFTRRNASADAIGQIVCEPEHSKNNVNELFV